MALGHARAWASPLVPTEPEASATVVDHSPRPEPDAMRVGSFEHPSSPEIIVTAVEIDSFPPSYKRGWHHPANGRLGVV
jgi:hypothetical protein